MRVALSQPQMTADEVSEVTAVLLSNWITNGPKALEFEERFAAYVGAPRALATSSCTAAIEIALRVEDVAGKDVFVPAIGFSGVVHAVERAGGRAVLVDVMPDDGHISVDALRCALSASDTPGAVLPVHLNGMPCDMAPIESLAREFDLPIIEDAAHALPAALPDRTIGDPGGYPRRWTAFSFQATKTLVTAEGGALTGPSEGLDRVVKSGWRLHGMTRDAWSRTTGGGPMWFYDMVEPGLKANMSDVHAAIGVAQLRRSDEMQARRVQISDQYDAAFEGIFGRPTRLPGCTWSRYVYPLLAPTEEARNSVLEALAMAEIGASVYFIPTHMMTVYRSRQFGPLPGAERYFSRHFGIACHAGMTDEQTSYVISTLLRIARDLKL